METEPPNLADPEAPKPVALEYVSAKLRPRRHGGPGNDWWALWALLLWFVLFAAIIGLAFLLAQR